MKTLKEWNEFAAEHNEGDLSAFCKPGELVFGDIVESFVDQLPPTSLKHDYVQAGEPCAHYLMSPGSDQASASYHTFYRVKKDVWRYCGKCFLSSFYDVATMRDAKDISGFLKATRNLDEPMASMASVHNRPRIICNDGFTMSVHAGKSYYSCPRDDDGPYTACEVGALSKKEEMLMPYAEGPDKPMKTAYAYVPIEVIDAVIAKHGGFFKGI